MGFQQGLSGLNASSKALDTIGNNIANSGTVGFKNGSAQFADVFAASLNGSGAAPVGIGAKVATIVQQFTQGNISVTNNPLDTAINGSGFFQMDDGVGGTYYSRNGQFQLDKDGFIVNAQGLQLKGIKAIDGVIATGSPSEPLRLFDPTQSLSGTPLATGGSTGATGLQANVNLDSREPAPTVTTFAYNNPNSYNKSTATTIYDSLGNAHTYSMYFVKIPAGSSVAAAGSAAIQTAADAALANEIANGLAGAQDAANAVATQAATLEGLISAAATAASDAAADPTNAALAAAATAATAAAAAAINSFAADAQALAVTDAVTAGATLAEATGYASKAVSAALTQGANQWRVYATVTNPAGAVPTFADLSAGGTNSLGTLTFNTSGTITSTAFAATLTDANFGYAGAVDPTQTFAVDFAGSTQYGAAFAVNALLQDGYTSGTLSGFNIGTDGIVLGRYTNGQSKAVGQVVLATFRNPQGLQPLGNNVWAVTPTSGDPITGSPGTSGQFGVLQSAALEDANVDLTAELVNMITQQRAYQANAQTIKTQDSVLQTLVNLR